MLELGSERILPYMVALIQYKTIPSVKFLTLFLKLALAHEIIHPLVHLGEENKCKNTTF